MGQVSGNHLPHIKRHMSLVIIGDGGSAVSFVAVN
jgi:hypothetical protein